MEGLQKASVDSYIDWYNWSEEVLDKAKREDKLIFLSIVSFDSKKDTREDDYYEEEFIRDVIKENYIPIKVDIEERRDIEKLYMHFSEILIGISSYPLNLVLTPEGIPIYSDGDIFFDKMEEEDLLEIFTSLSLNWKHNKDFMISRSEFLLDEVKKYYEEFEKGKIDRHIFDNAKDKILYIYDRDQGAFYKKQKMLLPNLTIFLLRYNLMYEDQGVEDTIKDHIDRIYKSAMHDHIGGGFFSLSKDETLYNPEIEKSLRKNCLMAYKYQVAYEQFGKIEYKKATDSILKLILRDYLSEEGLVYNGIIEENKLAYYFSEDEIINLLGEDIGKKYIEVYNIQDGYNNIPHLRDRSDREIESLPVESINDMLYEYRRLKSFENKDKRILVLANSVVAGLFAYVGASEESDFLLNKSRNILDFILENMLDEDYNLSPVYLEGKISGKSNLMDYGSLLFALVNLFISTEDYKYIEVALEISKKVEDNFYSRELNSLYLNKKDDSLLVNLKDYVDDIQPSSSSIMAYVWLKLYKITGNSHYYKLYRNIISSYSKNILEDPLSFIYTIMTMYYL